MTDLYKEGAKFALEQAKDGKMQAIFPLPFLKKRELRDTARGGRRLGSRVEAKINQLCAGDFGARHL